MIKIKTLQTTITSITMATTAGRTIYGKLACKKKELDLGITLKGGQSFRWKEIPDNKYIGVFDSDVWTLSQDDENLNFIAHNTKKKTPAECKKKLRKYFNLDISLEENLQDWSNRDEHFKNFTEKVAGVRILDQDVVENVFCFICSANNNISRITSMIEKMSLNFGKKLCEVDGKMYYDFPKIDALAEESVEGALISFGFGYRAKYIHQSAKKLLELGGRKWLEKLKKSRGGTYENVRSELRVLPGVGYKVADCICLMSLEHLEAIPVDTHIFQVAKEFYIPDLNERCKAKTATTPIYSEINEYFRDIWGEKAGWAQAVVFCARISKKNIKEVNNEKDIDDVQQKTRKKRVKKC